jgi:hypothetical protein
MAHSPAKPGEGIGSIPLLATKRGVGAVSAIADTIGVGRFDFSHFSDYIISGAVGRPARRTLSFLAH